MPVAPVNHNHTLRVSTTAQPPLSLPQRQCRCNFRRRYTKLDTTAAADRSIPARLLHSARVSTSTPDSTPPNPPTVLFPLVPSAPPILPPLRPARHCRRRRPFHHEKYSLLPPSPRHHVTTVVLVLNLRRQAACHRVAHRRLCDEQASTHMAVQPFFFACRTAAAQIYRYLLGRRTSRTRRQ